MNVLRNTILALEAGGTEGVSRFWNTPAGTALGYLLDAVGIILLIAAGFKAFTHFSAGKVGQGVKIVLGAGIVAAFLIFPELFEVLASMLGRVVSLVIESFGDIIG